MTLKSMTVSIRTLPCAQLTHCTHIHTYTHKESAAKPRPQVQPTTKAPTTVQKPNDSSRQALSKPNRKGQLASVP